MGNKGTFILNNVHVIHTVVSKSFLSEACFFLTYNYSTLQPKGINVTTYILKNTQLSCSQEPTQRNTNTPVEITLWVTVPQLKWHFGGLAIQRKQVIGERWRGRTRWQRFVVFSFYAFRLLLVLGLSHGDQAAQPPVVLDELNGVNCEAAGLRGDVQHGGRPGFVCGWLMQRRILDFHGTKLTLEQVKGAAVGLVG